MSIERIKFRGKAKVKKPVEMCGYVVNPNEWITTDAILNAPLKDNVDTEKRTIVEAIHEFWHLVDDGWIDPATIGQWTGLVDSKGVEIYEGDRLKSIEHPQDEPFVVESITPIDRLYGSYDTPRGDDWMSNAEYYEVIGNVHEVTT